MIPTKRLTNSEIKTWKTCPRMWYLSYYCCLGKKDVDFNRPLSIGSRTHDCLAAYYDPQRRLDPLKWLDASLAKDLAEYPAFEDELKKEGDLCRAMLEGYVEWLQETGADQGLRLIATEGAREVPLEPNTLPGVTLLTKLDARVLRESDGARLALEHKTVGDLSTPLQLLQLDQQLLTEHLVEVMALRREGRDDEAAQGVMYNMLRKVKRTVRAKPPFYGRETVMHNKAELRHHWMHVYETARQIMSAVERLNAGEDHHFVCPPNPDLKNSRWNNPFIKLYLLMDDGSDWEAAAADLYEVINPLERYAHLSAAEVNAAGVGLLA